MKLQSQTGPLALGFALAILAVPVAAQDQADEEGSVVNARLYQELVGFNDLDLRKGTDKNVLIRRVKSASRRVCGNMARDRLIERFDRSICTKSTYLDTRPQIRRAFARADAGDTLAFTLTIGSGKKKI